MVKVVRQLKENEAIRRVFDTLDGKIVMGALLRHGCVTTPVAAATPEETQMNVGCQRLILSLAKKAYGTDKTDEILKQIEEQ